MSCPCDNDDDYLMDSNGCVRCECTSHKVKGRFGLAWVSESPECPCPEPVGWQVEFCDTPSKVEQKCQEMVRWINCPPLPRCDPCPPVELCCSSQKKKCPCKKSDGQRSYAKPRQKKCCCCGGQSRPQSQPGRGCYQNAHGYRSRSPNRY